MLPTCAPPRGELESMKLYVRLAESLILIVHGMESVASNPPSAMTGAGDATLDADVVLVAAMVEEAASVDDIGVELRELIEDTVAVGMLVETAPTSDEDEDPISTIEDVVEVMGVEVAVLLVVSGDALDKAVDITGVLEEDGLAEPVTT